MVWLKKGAVDCVFAPLYTVRVPIINHANLSLESQAELERELPDFGTLMEFVAWGTRQNPPVLLLESIALDEYTHEVISKWVAASERTDERNALFLVLGAT